MARILIVDDDDLVREMIVTALEQEGLETLQAANGRDGIDLARSSHPDLILCDIQMPDLDGYGMLSALRNEEATSTIPFIFLTGHADRKNVRHGMELGADDFLAKPVSVVELLAAINSRLQKQHLVQKQTEKKLNELRANISLSLPHEIRTPLSGIIGFAEVLKDDNASLKSEEITEMAAMILKSAQRLGNLVENFLSYAQLELLAADPERIAALRTERTSMLDVHIEDVSRKKAESLGRADDLALELSGGEAAISNQHIRRVVEELMDNACKFSKEGTSIEVTTKREGDTYFLSVADHGIGMTGKQMKDVGAYKQFERNSREQQGTGLGLAIVKKLVELYGGKLTLQSEVRKGTTVVVQLLVP